uniref:Uncharacterized protein n=1 Tax=Rhizophora mucronata TaxID=61149 RepID=A0A2P2N8R2_RHIMU
MVNMISMSTNSDIRWCTCNIFKFHNHALNHFQSP